MGRYYFIRRYIVNALNKCVSCSMIVKAKRNAEQAPMGTGACSVLV